MTIEERIQALEKEIRETPHHKGTDHYIGRLRARIAQLKSEVFCPRGSGGSGGGYAVKKSGNASVVLLGPPSVGKSSLLNQLTQAQSKVAGYDFTTLWVIPGMLDYQGAKIQLFDVPGIIEGAARGKGRGKEVLSVVRNCDLILIVVDVNSVGKVETIKKELYEFGVRFDEQPPKVLIKKDIRGGVKVSSTVPLSFVSPETVRQIASEFRLKNGEVVIKENITLNRLIDAFMGNRIYLPYLVLVNKSDLAKNGMANIDKNYLFISAYKGQGLEELKQKIWEKLNLIHLYLKPRDSKVDLDQPLIVKKGFSLREIFEAISMPNKDLITRVKLYGAGAKFPGQEVSFDFQPIEGTIISFLP